MGNNENERGLQTAQLPQQKDLKDREFIFGERELELRREQQQNESAHKQQELEHRRQRQQKELDLKEREFELRREQQQKELDLKKEETDLQRQQQQKELELREKGLALRSEQQQKELAHKDQELEIQRQQSWWSRWNTPAVAAIIAGLLGYLGTLINSHQGRLLERDKQDAVLKVERQKQEGTLILDAIKTTGTAEEKERFAAANLVFLADAGLITSIPDQQLEKLRSKAGNAGPSLPAPSLPAPPGVDFKRSSTLNAELQASLQSAILAYQGYLAGLGYDPGKAKDRVVVRVDEDLRDNAYFDNTSVVISANLARDPEYVLSEYTWYVLKQVNPRGFQTLLETPSFQFRGFCQGLKFYFTCSYRNEPFVGKNFYSLSGVSGAGHSQVYLFNLAEFKAFEKTGDPEAEEEHKLGEIWGGAFWDLRKEFGKEKTDRLLMTTWKHLKPVQTDLSKPSFFVNQILEARKSTGYDLDAQVIRQAFDRRKLK